MGTITKRALALVLAALVGASVLILPATSASAADNGDWAAYPKRPVNAGPQFTPRVYFFFDVAPGSVIRDTVTIANSTLAPLPLSVYPADAYNVRTGGGFAVSQIDQKPKDIGTWITMSKDNVVVPAAKTETIKATGKKRIIPGKINVPFTMKVPRGATPGDHAGGIVTIEPPPTPQSSGATGANVGVRRSLTVRVYTRVSGPLNPQLLVNDVHYTHVKPAVMPFLGSQGGAAIEYTFTNTGNVRITPLSTVTFKGLLGRTLHSTGTKPGPEILPGQTITLTQAVTGMPVLDRVTARVELKGNAASEPKVANVKAAGDVVAWVISWIFVAVMIVAIIAFVLWRRQKRRAAAAPTQRPGRRRAPEMTSP